MGKFKHFASQKRWYIFVTLVFLLGIANWQYPTVRSSHVFINYLVMLIIFLLPTLLLLMIYTGAKKQVRVVAFMVLAPFLIFASLYAFFTFILLTDIMRTGSDPSFEHLRSTQYKHNRISVYRTNGGAMTSFGIVARHEKALFPDLLLVRDVYSVYPGEDAKVVMLDNGTAKIISPPYGSKRPKTDEAIIKLKPWIYW